MMDPSAPTPPPSLQQPPAPMVPPSTTLPPVQPVTVPNPTPNVTGAVTSGVGVSPTPSSHPPYAQMITEAITALKERDGSSKQAISKYIERVYSNLPDKHSALLTQHLKHLRTTGHLVMVKNSYKLAGSAGSTEQIQANGPKKGRGRPAKTKSAQTQQVPVQQEQPPLNATAGPGPTSVPESVFASLGLVDGPAVAVTKKSPGRPRKVVPVAAVNLQPKPAVANKRPGRPRKNAAFNATGSAAGRPRGRPPKNAGGQLKRRGRPPKNAAAAAGALLVPTGYVAETATITAPAPPVVAAVPTLKRRGRPPKASVGAKKPKKLGGKPLGRPKKNAATPGAQVSNLQQLMAYQELKSKLEFFQSRIKQTVGVLKPCLDSQSALAALQELEELAAIDVTAPLNLQNRQAPAPPPPPETPQV